MDTLTQAALGAAVGGTVLGKRLGRKAVVIGALLGTLPDLDVVLDYGDAVSNMTEHRGFSHSLWVLTLLGTLLALLAARFAPARDISLGRWWWFFILALVTHPLLDALTTYGTQLFWPSATPPVAWPIVFIIDPLYSLPLLVGIGVALVGHRMQRACAWGLAISCLYLLLATGAKQWVEYRLAPVLAEHGLQQAPRLVQPTPFNILLWRVTIIAQDEHYESLISVFDGDHQPYLARFHRGTHLEPLALETRHGQRLDWFSGPFLRYDTELINEQTILLATDIRLGFPGFYPFSFTLARRDERRWQALEAPRLVDTSRDLQREVLLRLARRALGRPTALCPGDYVAPRWHIEPTADC